VLPHPLWRAATLIGALSLLALAGPASAGAIVMESQITAPGSPTYAFYDGTEPSPPAAFKVEGTTNIGGNVAVRCYYGSGESEYTTLVEEVTPGNGEFSAEVSASAVSSGPCVLRAVPVGNKEPHPPGTTAEEALQPYKGPRIVGSSFKLGEEGSDYQLQASTLSSYLAINSVGGCGLEYSAMFAPETLATGALFDCNAALYSENSTPLGNGNKPSRSELQVDGANAYSPAAAHAVEEAIGFEKTGKFEPVKLPGAPQVAATKTFGSASRLATIKEIDPIVKCAPSTAFPPTASSCKEFVETGVELEREWQTSDGDQMAEMTDNWRSTNGASHALNALYDQETVNEGSGGGAYEFPDTNVFSATTAGETQTLPAGLGRIYYKSDSETPVGGDGLHPQGAIVYDTPPNGPISVYRGTAEKEGFNGFVMPYQATIPAGGAYTLHMAFVQAYKLSEVEALSSEVLAGYPPSEPPALSIASPANGATVSTSSVTVSGTVTDKRAITSFTVDGNAVSVGPKGEWSTSVALNKGANTIKALATDQAGFSAEKTVTVTYAPPAPKAHARQVGGAKGNNSAVTFTVACKGEAGASCEVESTLTTIKKLRHGRLVAVSGRRHPKNRTEKVTVGSSKLTIPAGQKVTISISLNATGKSLLARFRALPVHLSVVQISGGHRSAIIAENLTVTPHRRHKQHHHHHHHH
jgi:hypothetical protein